MFCNILPFLFFSVCNFKNIIVNFTQREKYPTATCQHIVSVNDIEWFTKQYNERVLFSEYSESKLY